MDLSTKKPISRHTLIRNFAKLADDLRVHGIRRVSDYAEILVAEALAGERVVSGVNRGFDVVAPSFGRIEVKHRVLPADGRNERRVELSEAKSGGFDYLAIVVFDCAISVEGAVLVPYGEVWELVGSRKWRRVSFEEATAISNSINITEQVAMALQR